MRKNTFKPKLDILSVTLTLLHRNKYIMVICFADFKSYPKSILTPENNKKVYKIVFAKRQMKFQEIADNLTISKDYFFINIYP